MTGRGGAARRLLLWLAALVAVAGVAGVVGAAPAGAHTELVASRPAPQAVLDTPPGEIVLGFSRPVVPGPDAVRVLDQARRRIDVGGVRGTDAGRSVAVALSPDAGPGVYTVSWQVVADDGHPLRGAYTFRVGTGPAVRPNAATTDAGAGGGRLGWWLGVSRWLAYGGLAVVLGAAGFLVAVWPAGWADRRARRLLVAGWSAATAGTAAVLALLGPDAVGGSVADVPGLLDDTVRTRAGGALAARLALLLLVAGLLARRTAPGRVATAAWAVVAAAIVLLTALAGHAASSDAAALAVLVDAVHLAAVAVWLGGIAVVWASLLPARPDAAHEVARFSRIAFGCVVVAAATGTAQAWREVGSLDALTQTRYGDLLVAKVAVFGALLGVAAVSRRLVRRRRAGGAGLRRSVAAELGLSAVVLGVASALVTTPPARTSYARPFRAELHVRALRLDVEVAPARVGPVRIDVRMAGGSGAPAPFVAVELRLPDEDIGPLFVRMQRLAPGHYRAEGVDLPLPGRWELAAEVFLGRGDDARATASFDVT